MKDLRDLKDLTIHDTRSPNALAGVRGEVEKGESPGPTLKTEDSNV